MNPTGDLVYEQELLRCMYYAGWNTRVFCVPENARSLWDNVEK